MLGAEKGNAVNLLRYLIYRGLEQPPAEDSA
jgi:hypothetical protein